ncbi:MAG: Tol-Pal system beta propeller repeat protein TolB [Pseudomonadota bacterium]
MGDRRRPFLFLPFQRPFDTGQILGTFTQALGIIAFILLLFPAKGSAKIYIDINAPSIQRIQIAIPDFKNLSSQKEQPELSAAMPQVVSNDLELSGYFRPIEKSAFLMKEDSSFSPGSIRFKDWSAIGAELLLYGAYTCIGRSLEVEARLYDVFSGRQILGKRLLSKTEDYRTVMHRLGNEIIHLLTGHEGMFLSKLAFVDNSTGHKEIYVSDLDGYNIKQLTSDKSIALFPRWSPAGDKIIYNSYKEGGGPTLYMRELSSGSDRRVSARKGLNIGGAWTSDGQNVALTLSSGDNLDIYLIDLKGKIISRLTDHWGIDVSPSYSPDGSRMAFVSNRSGSPQIYIRDLKLGKEERLTFEGKYNTSPSWSRLNRIAYTGMNNGRFDIYTINPDGTDLRLLTQDQGNNEDPCWSPDGRYIVFTSSREGGYHLYLMNANGQNQRRLFNKSGNQSSPSWAPF